MIEELKALAERVAALEAALLPHPRDPAAWPPDYQLFGDWEIRSDGLQRGHLDLIVCPQRPTSIGSQVLAVLEEAHRLHPRPQVVSIYEKGRWGRHMVLSVKRVGNRWVGQYANGKEIDAGALSATTPPA
jgi:hypothetical protein